MGKAERFKQSKRGSGRRPAVTLPSASVEEKKARDEFVSVSRFSLLRQADGFQNRTLDASESESRRASRNDPEHTFCGCGIDFYDVRNSRYSLCSR